MSKRVDIDNESCVTGVVVGVIVVNVDEINQKRKTKDRTKIFPTLHLLTLVHTYTHSLSLYLSLAAYADVYVCKGVCVCVRLICTCSFAPSIYLQLSFMSHECTDAVLSFFLSLSLSLSLSHSVHFTFPHSNVNIFPVVQ